jgi:hypothetical protein
MLNQEIVAVHQYKTKSSANRETERKKRKAEGNKNTIPLVLKVPRQCPFVLLLGVM